MVTHPTSTCHMPRSNLRAARMLKLDRPLVRPPRCIAPGRASRNQRTACICLGCASCQRSLANGLLGPRCTRRLVHAYFQLTHVFAQHASGFAGDGGNGARQWHFAVLRPLECQAEQQLETRCARLCFCKRQGFFIFAHRTMVGDQSIDGAVCQGLAQCIAVALLTQRWRHARTAVESTPHRHQ